MVTSAYAPLSFPRKDADAKIAYALDWTDWLNDGETIDTAIVEVDGADKMGSESIFEGRETRVIIGGGTPGTIATVHFHVISSTGLEDERTVNLAIVER